MASIVYNAAKGAFTDGTLDWDDDVIRVLLLSASATPDPDHATLADVLAPGGTTECSTVAYERKNLTGRVVTVDNTNDRAVLNANNVIWEAIGDGSESAVSAVIYQQVGGDDNSPASDVPVCLIDITDTVLNGGDFTIQWSSNGIITLT